MNNRAGKFTKSNELVRNEIRNDPLWLNSTTRTKTYIVHSHYTTDRTTMNVRYTTTYQQTKTQGEQNPPLDR